MAAKIDVPTERAAIGEATFFIPASKSYPMNGPVTPSDDRGDVAVETLLKVVLALVAVLLVLQIVGTVVGWIASLLVPVLTLAIAAVIVLWFLDAI